MSPVVSNSKTSLATVEAPVLAPTSALAELSGPSQDSRSTHTHVAPSHATDFSILDRVLELTKSVPPHKLGITGLAADFLLSSEHELPGRYTLGDVFLEYADCYLNYLNLAKQYREDSQKESSHQKRVSHIEELELGIRMLRAECLEARRL